MVFGFFKRRKLEGEIERLKEVMKGSFLNVKDDLSKVSNWISYLNEKDKELDVKIEKMDLKIDDLRKELEELKEYFAISSGAFKGVFKQPKQVFKQQTGVWGVQTAVQTAVQTPKIKKSEAKIAILQNLTVMERAILWILLNSEMKLSCEDIAKVLGKNENTIRGQLNNIKTKLPDLVNEMLEKNGKKRYYIEEKTKEFLFKSIKMRVKERGKEKR